jgi:hypothetical protein
VRIENEQHLVIAACISLMTVLLDCLGRFIPFGGSENKVLPGSLLDQGSGHTEWKIETKKGRNTLLESKQKKQPKTFQHAQSQIQKPASTYFVTSVPVSHMGKSPWRIQSCLPKHTALPPLLI